MTDLPPMDPCPADKRGRHELMALFVNDVEHAPDTDVTFACQRCGALRRVPLTGALVISRLDDASAQEIYETATGGPWELR
jgi:hypothetical protein